MMKLSTILADAADMLCCGEHDYSCNAVGFAYGRAKFNCTKDEEVHYFPRFIHGGFVNMGMDLVLYSDLSVRNFYDCEEGDERHNARILWLLWAALMAREQGL